MQRSNYRRSRTDLIERRQPEIMGYSVVLGPVFGAFSDNAAKSSRFLTHPVPFVVISLPTGFSHNSITAAAYAVPKHHRDKQTDSA